MIIIVQSKAIDALKFIKIILSFKNTISKVIVKTKINKVQRKKKRKKTEIYFGFTLFVLKIEKIEKNSEKITIIGIRNPNCGNKNEIKK
ncbi:hypothetical protein [Mesoplasma chauliocola]|uniref:hypothetical protein n=1 Tax=Mesoplasma chauliocola TaxID=216427 RepID=UPI0004B2603E|nr:hypothetical protein [Mesoplasma chauliocola]